MLLLWLFLLLAIAMLYLVVLVMHRRVCEVGIIYPKLEEQSTANHVRVRPLLVGQTSSSGGANARGSMGGLYDYCHNLLVILF